MAKSKETARQSNLSQERVQDSSDEGESPVKQVTPNKKAKSSAPQEAKSSQKSSKKSKQKSPTPETTEESTAESSEAESEQEDSGSESDTSSASSQKRTAPAPAESQPRKKSKMTSTSAAVQIAPKPFKAPSGYEPIVLSASDYASEMGAIFDDLSGKQIWHISVPDGVSIESIKELDIAATIQGQPILSKNGINYNLHSVDAQDEVVLLPQGSKLSYKQTTKKVERIFHLQEMSTNTNTKSTEEPSLVFTATGSGAAKPVRKQPEGLKMRYVPWGAPPIQEPSEDEDVEMKDTLDLRPELEPVSPPATSKKSKKSKESADGKSPEKKSRAKDDQGSVEKKKKKKRRLVDEDVL
jgi:hypothetical protein